MAAARLAGLVIRWTAAVERRRQRLDLLDLTDDQLRDIGVTRAQARREAGAAVLGLKPDRPVRRGFVSVSSSLPNGRGLG